MCVQIVEGSQLIKKKKGNRESTQIVSNIVLFLFRRENVYVSLVFTVSIVTRVVPVDTMVWDVLCTVTVRREWTVM